MQTRQRGAQATVNEALLLKTETTRAQAEASDQWTYYQAKGIKASVEYTARAWLAADRTPPDELEQTATRYEREQTQIQQSAREKEAERDEKSTEADHLLIRHRGFANAVALLQVALRLAQSQH